MNFADSFFDRHMSSTYNNDYADPLGDENRWEERLFDSDPEQDVDVDEFLITSDVARAFVN